MPLISTLGAASSRGFGEFSRQVQGKYIEDYFSTYLYTGNGASQTINNGIALADTASWSSIKLIDSTSIGSVGRSVFTDSSGNVYVGGTAWDTANYIVLAKYNPFGSLQWQRKIRQNTSSNGRVSVDPSGNVYIVGVANNGTANYAAILKYDSSGSLQWQRKLSHASTLAFTPNGMAVDSSSNVYVIGTYGNSTYSVIAKYDSSGAIQWQRRFNVGAVTQQGFGVAVDSSLNVYTVGDNAGFSINKYDSSGAIQWQRFLDASGSGRSVAVDSSNNIYVCGKGDTNKILLAKYNTSGAIQWQRTLVDAASSSNTGEFITTDSSGDVYVCGTLYDGALTYMVVAKYNSSGTVQWKRKIQQGNTYGTGVHVDTSGNLYATGFPNDGKNYFLAVKLLADGTTTSGSAFVTMSESPATSATSSVSEGANTGTDAAGPAVDAAGTATDSAGTATSSIATQPAVTGAGGLVWIKGRSGATDHALYDTARGATFDLVSNSTAAQTTQSTGLTAFSASGFSIGSLAKLNSSSAIYAAWTFRKQPKFFDIVTYTGDGVSGRQIPHNLGSVPGMIIIKSTSAVVNWVVQHRSLSTPGQYLVLNSDVAVATNTNIYNANPTSTYFQVGGSQTVNNNGDTYVAYLFAHDTAADGVIQCGSYVGNGSATGPEINLGWEPQFLITKSASASEPYSWVMQDDMRGFAVTGSQYVYAYSSSNEQGPSPFSKPLATGFQPQNGTLSNASGVTYIYLAIRRGPMRTPTDATKVLEITARTGNGVANTVVGSSITVDAAFVKARTQTASTVTAERLVGSDFLSTALTDAVAADGDVFPQNPWDTQVGFKVGNGGTISNQTNRSTYTYINYGFKRAPSFMDVVCYSGNGSTTQNVSHNLGVQPELIIYKSRTNANDWVVHTPALISQNKFLWLNRTDAATDNSTAGYTNSGTPTSTLIRPGLNQLNLSGWNYVAYLFATCTGVSKVGTYTGTGTTQQIDCGFTAGARFVMIKRTDNSGGWHIWDSARGIVAGNDPFFLLNSTSAETTGTDYVDTYAAGFEISSTAPVAINANGGTYLFLAIA